MSSCSVEEHGTTTGRHHAHNGYYAFRGPIVRTLAYPPHPVPAPSPRAGRLQR